MKMTMQAQIDQLAETDKRLMTRVDFVGMYRISFSTLSKHIQNGNIALHLIGASIMIDADEALAVLGNPPLRNPAPVVRADLFA
jgi:hypothetical protein